MGAAVCDLSLDSLPSEQHAWSCHTSRGEVKGQGQTGTSMGSSLSAFMERCVLRTPGPHPTQLSKQGFQDRNHKIPCLTSRDKVASWGP